MLRLEDFRLAIRRLRKDAGTTIASVAALACAIGAAVATWSLLSAVLVKPIPVVEPERLFQVETPPPPNFVGAALGFSYPEFESIRDSSAFEGVAAGGTSFKVARSTSLHTISSQRSASAPRWAERSLRPRTGAEHPRWRYCRITTGDACSMQTRMCWVAR